MTASRASAALLVKEAARSGSLPSAHAARKSSAVVLISSVLSGPVLTSVDFDSEPRPPPSPPTRLYAP